MVVEGRGGRRDKRIERTGGWMDGIEMERMGCSKVSRTT
jgi:hypothetical protein